MQKRLWFQGMVMAAAFFLVSVEIAQAGPRIVTPRLSIVESGAVLCNVSSG